MEFSGQYLTYDEYLELGGTIEQMPFNLLEYEARRRINKRTQERLKGIETKDIPFEVKLCVNNLINSMSTYNEALENISKGVTTENIDGYSVSYITGSQAQEVLNTKDKELESIITNDLMNVVVNKKHILYLGVE